METGRGSSTGNHPNGAQDTHGGHGAPEHRGGGRIADLVSPQGGPQDQQPRPAAMLAPRKRLFFAMLHRRNSVFFVKKERVPMQMIAESFARMTDLTKDYL